jgi:hypothetical protein
VTSIDTDLPMIILDICVILVGTFQFSGMDTSIIFEQAFLVSLRTSLLSFGSRVYVDAAWRKSHAESDNLRKCFYYQEFFFSLIEGLSSVLPIY